MTAMLKSPHLATLSAAALALARWIIDPEDGLAPVQGAVALLEFLGPVELRPTGNGVQVDRDRRALPLLRCDIVGGDKSTTNTSAGQGNSSQPKPATRPGGFGEASVKSSWANGLFYLFAFLAIVGVLGWIASMVSFSTLALIVVGGIIAVPVIGALQLRMELHGNALKMEYGDNGQGVQKDSAGGFGSTLVQILVEQWDGKMQSFSHPSVSYKLEMPIPAPMPYRSLLVSPITLTRMGTL